MDNAKASVCEGLKHLIDQRIVYTLFNFTRGTTLIGRVDSTGENNYIFNYCPMCGAKTSDGVPQCP